MFFLKRVTSQLAVSMMFLIFFLFIFFQVLMLIPGLAYEYETLVECISEVGISDQIRVFIIKANQTQPLVEAVINMPISDPGAAVT